MLVLWVLRYFFWTECGPPLRYRGSPSGAAVEEPSPFYSRTVQASLGEACAVSLYYAGEACAVVPRYSETNTINVGSGSAEELRAGPSQKSGLVASPPLRTAKGHEQSGMVRMAHRAVTFLTHVNTTKNRLFLLNVGDFTVMLHALHVAKGYAH